MVAPRPIRIWAHRALTWVVICGAVVVVGYQVSYRVRVSPWDEVSARPRAADLPCLRRLVAERPRAPERRRALARALTLAGDLRGAARQRALAVRFDVHANP